MQEMKRIRLIQALHNCGVVQALYRQYAARVDDFLRKEDVSLKQLGGRDAQGQTYQIRRLREWRPWAAGNIDCQVSVGSRVIRVTEGWLAYSHLDSQK